MNSTFLSGSLCDWGLESWCLVVVAHSKHSHTQPESSVYALWHQPNFLVVFCPALCNPLLLGCQFEPVIVLGFLPDSPMQFWAVIWLQLKMSEHFPLDGRLIPVGYFCSLECCQSGLELLTYNTGIKNLVWWVSLLLLQAYFLAIFSSWPTYEYAENLSFFLEFWVFSLSFEFVSWVFLFSSEDLSLEFWLFFMSFFM